MEKENNSVFLAYMHMRQVSSITTHVDHNIDNNSRRRMEEAGGVVVEYVK
jgi:hypothetical protein